jgi:hypothetical protein
VVSAATVGQRRAAGGAANRVRSEASMAPMVRSVKEAGRAAGRAEEVDKGMA